VYMVQVSVLSGSYCGCYATCPAYRCRGRYLPCPAYYRRGQSGLPGPFALSGPPLMVSQVRVWSAWSVWSVLEETVVVTLVGVEVVEVVEVARSPATPAMERWSEHAAECMLTNDNESPESGHHSGGSGSRP
jgi:hypothetical protein